MSFQSNGTDITLVAAADLSGKQFYAVKVDSNGKAALCVAGDFAIGMLQNKPASGEQGTVRIAGVSKGAAGGSITAGNLLAADANGKLVAATLSRTNTSDGGAAVDALLGSNVVGVALESASSGEIFAVALALAGASPTTIA